MAESVNKYDGFYVGRYETSRNGSNPQSKYGATTAYNSSTENDWYGLYALNKKYKTSSVQGSMIWGIQYDKMMSWMQGYTTNTKGYNTNRTCGTAPGDVIKNVFDLFGNSQEWTCLANGSNDGRYAMGGHYDWEAGPGNRGGAFPTNTFGYDGSRLALYIV